MNTWTDTHKSLPSDLECVQFLVAGHLRPLYGIFTERHFLARWIAYLPDEVFVWRKLGEAPQEAPPPPRRADARPYWSERPMR